MQPQEELLEAVILHLRRLKERGTRYVAVSPDVLTAFDRPSARAPVTRPPTWATQQASGLVQHGAGSASAPPRPAVAASLSPVAPGRQAMPPAPALPATLPQPPPAMTPAVAAGGQDKATALADLRNRVLNCTRCPSLVAARTNAVFGVGNPEAGLMFVGEAPGADEDLQGEPFVGKAGQLLTKMIQTMGLSREAVYIANILKCRPDMPPGTSGNRKPTPEEMQTCISYLQGQIDIIRPQVIVALGATAVEGLLGKTEGITRLRGQWREYRGIPLMPTYHPAYLLRNQAVSEKRRVWEDLLQVMQKLGLPITERQRTFFLKAQGAG